MNNRDTHTLENLPPAVLAALRKHATAAIDNPTLYHFGTLYDTVFHEYVIPRVTEDCPVTDKLTGIVEVPEGFDERQACLKRVAATLRLAPRGMWTILHEHGPTREYYTAIMSAGNGVLNAHRDNLRTLPTFQHTYERMVGYEGYLIKHEIRNERERQANIAALVEFAVGDKLRNLSRLLGGYGTGTVETLDATTGNVTVLLTKRGTKTRWRSTFGAASLKQAVGKLERARS